MSITNEHIDAFYLADFEFKDPVNATQNSYKKYKKFVNYKLSNQPKYQILFHK